MEQSIWYSGINHSKINLLLCLDWMLLLLLLSLQSCPTLCDPIDGSPPGSPIPGILQARTLEWVAISFSNAWKWKVKAKSLSHVRLCSSAHGIFQARVLECGLNEELLILKYSLKKGKWRFYGGEPDPEWCFYPQWNVVFFETLWFRSVHETFIDHYLGKLVYLQGTELSLVGNTKN